MKRKAGSGRPRTARERSREH